MLIFGSFDVCKIYELHQTLERLTMDTMSTFAPWPLDDITSENTARFSGRTRVVKGPTNSRPNPARTQKLI